LESIGGAQLVTVETSLGKIPQPIRWLHFAPALAK
jgi:hypothetical protein